MNFRPSTTNSTRHLSHSANPANAPIIDAVANGDFSEEPQKLRLNLHGDPCTALRGSAVKAACDQVRFSTAIGLRIRSGTIWQGGLLFIDPFFNGLIPLQAVVSGTDWPRFDVFGHSFWHGLSYFFGLSSRDGSHLDQLSTKDCSGRNP
jgi:hypothetical protein